MNLYVHIPFCRRACGYCDFTKSITSANVDGYAEDMCRQMEQYANFADKHLCHIYIGGGTPTTMSPEAIGRIVHYAQKLWNAAQEITIEANPDDLTDNYLQQLAETDVNRLSIGIQSFNDDELQLMNRRHTASQAIEAVERAYRYGFRNISIDLIYGLPYSTAQSWQATLNQAIALAPQHISAYHLTIEAGTAFAKRGTESVSEQLSETQYNLLHDTLLSNGYEHYEISNFALSGYRSCHNTDYWNGTPYLGIGAGAHSYDGNRHRFAFNLQSVLTEEFLNDEELYEEMVMLSLRTDDGLNIDTMRTKLGDNYAVRFESLAQPLLQQGLLQKTHGHKNAVCYKIPHRHWFILDSIVAKLI